MKPIRVGIIGAGGAARAIHVPGFQRCPGVELAAVCDADAAAAKATGIPDVYERPGDLLERAGVDAVVVSTPNFLHREIALAALAAGKHLLCEKPLALNLAEAKNMLAAAEVSGLVHMTAFTYGFTPAYRYLKHLVDAGQLGQIRTVRAAYLMALSGHLLGWRSLKKFAGSGVLADIGSHLIHLVRGVAGEVSSLTATRRNFRDDPSSDVEDWISFLANFSSGASGTFEISRVCPGRGAGISEEMFVEVYGTLGSAVFSLQEPSALRVALGEDGLDPTRVLQRLDVPEQFLKLAGSPRDVNADDPRWGYRYDQAFQFVESIRTGQTRSPSFLDGVRCQAVLDAAIESSEKLRWVEVAS